MVAGNTTGSTGTDPDCDGSIGSLGFNLFSDPTGCGGLVGTDLSGTAAGLGPLADNGGPTCTHALMTGSPAIDAVGSGGAGCPPTDQRGAPRTGACDIGAYERVVCRGAV